MNTAIRHVHGRQILDSRGRPTVEAEVELVSGHLGRASVPSGASTGSAEAHELRDGDPTWYAGLGVLRAVGHVNDEIARLLQGRDARGQRDVDQLMCELDGTPQLSRLGANAVLAVSLASARAAAAAAQQPFYAYIGEISGSPPARMPVPMVNILSGGLHASRGMDVQDFLAIPARATSMSEAIHVIARVRSAATEEAQARGLPTLLADEGGLSPGLSTGRDALEMMLRSIERAGLRPGEDVVIAIDVAATALQQSNGQYALKREERILSADEMIAMQARWTAEFPVVSIEDSLGEEDWAAWGRLTARLGERVQLIGDDLFTTNRHRLARGVKEQVANGILVKANQNGTLTGTLDLIAAARTAGYATVVSARSGETEDAFMSDLAVGTAAGQIKIGSLRTSSTVAKYNQLLRIEEVSGAPVRRCERRRPLRAAVNGLDAFLVHTGLAAPGERCTWTPLSGGVSSDIWQVDLGGRPSICVKRALPKLKVAAHWEAPIERNAYEWAWMEFVATVLPGAVPHLLAHDASAGMFAMQYLPGGQYPQWKQQLLDGQVQPQTARDVGFRLGSIHSASAHRPDLLHAFDTSASFHAIRLEPYLLATARHHPALAKTLAGLVERTAAHRTALVHGDISPKNILVGPQGPVFLDAECAWYGDPAFDLAFCLNHLLLKCIVQPRQVGALRDSFDELVNTYFATALFESRDALESRAASLLPALLLARVDGKSPVEYLTAEADRAAVRRVAIPLIEEPPRLLDAVADRWFASLAPEDF